MSWHCGRTLIFLGKNKGVTHEIFVFFSPLTRVTSSFLYKYAWVYVKQPESLFSFQFIPVLMDLVFASTFLYSNTTWYSLQENKVLQTSRTVAEQNYVRGRYIMLDPKSQNRQGCCCFLSPAEWLWGLKKHCRHTHTKHTYTLHAYLHTCICVCGQTHRPQADTRSPHMNIVPKTSSCSLFWLGRVDVH